MLDLYHILPCRVLHLGIKFAPYSALSRVLTSWYWSCQGGPHTMAQKVWHSLLWRGPHILVNVENVPISARWVPTTWVSCSALIFPTGQGLTLLHRWCDNIIFVAMNRVSELYLLCHPSEDSIWSNTIPSGISPKDRQYPVEGWDDGFEPGTNDGSLVRYNMPYYAL